jgi:hypothetical protein
MIRLFTRTNVGRQLNMRQSHLFGVAGALVLAGMINIDLAAQVSADGRPMGSDPPRGEHHRVLPVQTELQRLILGKDVSVFVTLNLTGVVKDAKPDEAGLRSIRRDLAGAVARDGIVYFRIFHDKTADSHENKRLRDALRGLAQAEGFRGSKVDEEWRNDALTWRERITALNGGPPGLPGGDEPGLGNKTVRIYPVRTPLSRYLFEGSDCVVDCLAAPDEEVEDRVRVAIKAMTGKLDLVRRQEILFRVPFDVVAERSRVRLERLDALAKSLGFQRSRVAYGG